MAKKKGRAFFICPRWSEITGDLQTPAMGRHRKNMAAISSGQPIARSTLRKALLAANQTSGKMFNIDAYIVDQRAAKPQ